MDMASETVNTEACLREEGAGDCLAKAGSVEAAEGVGETLLTDPAREDPGLRDPRADLRGVELPPCPVFENIAWVEERVVASTGQWCLSRIVEWTVVHYVIELKSHSTCIQHTALDRITRQ